MAKEKPIEESHFIVFYSLGVVAWTLLCTAVCGYYHIENIEILISLGVFLLGFSFLAVTVMPIPMCVVGGCGLLIPEMNSVLGLAALVIGALPIILAFTTSDALLDTLKKPAWVLSIGGATSMCYFGAVYTGAGCALSLLFWLASQALAKRDRERFLAQKAAWEEMRKRRREGL